MAAAAFVPRTGGRGDEPSHHEKVTQFVSSARKCSRKLGNARLRFPQTQTVADESDVSVHHVTQVARRLRFAARRPNHGRVRIDVRFAKSRCERDDVLGDARAVNHRLKQRVARETVCAVNAGCADFAAGP